MVYTTPAHESNMSSIIEKSCGEEGKRDKDDNRPMR